MGDVIVHLFEPQTRAYYKIEELWSRGVSVVRFQ
jgi:ribosomal silencing factor RsfS